MNKKITYQYVLYMAMILIIGMVILSGCSKTGASSGDAETLYTCGMHPQVISDKPGLCPICHMKLIPIGSSATSGGSSGERIILYWESPDDPTYISDQAGKSPEGNDLVPVYEDDLMKGAGVLIDPSVVQNMGVRYSQVTKGPLSRTIRASAHVDYNEDHLAVLSIRTDGWVEKLYVTSPGASVKKGDPLFEFYSPRLYSAQEEYRIALRTGDATLKNAAKEKLKLLGVSDSQITSIGSKGISRNLTILAPIDGIVTEIGKSSGSAYQSASGGSSGAGGGESSGGMGGMGGMSSGEGASGVSGSSGSGGMNTGSGASIRQGDYIGAGTAVYTIADLSTLWVYAHLYQDEVAFVKEGMKAKLELDYLPGESFEGTVDFIYPFLDRQTRDIKIRMVFENPDGKLLPQMFGKVMIESKVSDDALIVLEESIINSGDTSIVFLSLSGGKFIPREVKTGPTDGQGNIQVISGLLEGQTIVSSGQFLLDSESKLKEAINKMLSTKQGVGSITQGHNHQAQKTGEPEKPSKEWPNLAPDDPNAKFKCPMPDDRYYAAEDGDCPICGMHLVLNDPSKGS